MALDNVPPNFDGHRPALFVAVLAAWIGVNLIVVAFGRPAFDAPAFLRLQCAVNLFALFIVTLVLVRRSAPVSR
jgi:uncharacterized membrane protein